MGKFSNVGYLRQQQFGEFFRKYFPQGSAIISVLYSIYIHTGMYKMYEMYRLIENLRAEGLQVYSRQKHPPPHPPPPPPHRYTHIHTCRTVRVDSIQQTADK